MTKHRLFALALAGVLALSLLLSACGKPAQPASSEPPAVTTEQPDAPQATTPAQSPIPEDTQAPTDSQPPADNTAPSGSKVQAIWDDISKQELPKLMDLDADILSALYGIDQADLVEYVGKMPVMNVHATEFFIAQVQPGKLDSVKSALEQRLADLEAQWSQYLPEQLELVQNAQLLTGGDYIMLAVTEHGAEAADAFNRNVK